MQATGRERGDRKKAVQPTLLHRGSTVSTLFDLIVGIQIPLIVLGVGRKVVGQKNLGFFFWSVFVLNTFNETWSVSSVKLKWQTSLSRH